MTPRIPSDEGEGKRKVEGGNLKGVRVSTREEEAEKGGLPGTNPTDLHRTVFVRKGGTYAANIENGEKEGKEWEGGNSKKRTLRVHLMFKKQKQGQDISSGTFNEQILLEKGNV